MLKEGFSLYLSPVIFIVRIAKNKLAYPLLKDTFSVLVSSRCEVLAVLELNDTLHSLRLSENSKG